MRLLPIVPRFENAVTLRGNVADPGRYPWRAGMRISDVIPNKESLLTRDYWKERNNLRVTGQTDRAHSAKPIPARRRADRTAARASRGDDKDRRHGRKPASDLPRESAQYARRYFLGRGHRLDDAPPLRDFYHAIHIQPAAPEINWEYAVVERTEKSTLASRIIPFNLEKAVVETRSRPGLALEPGDTITIFSKADFSLPRTQQAKQIRLEGEVAMAGVYTALPGETLRDLVKRAGGLTPNAYLYGAQFTRESRGGKQQKRFNDFLSQLERETNESAANLSGRVTSTEQAATAQATLASQRDLIARLRRFR